MKQAASGGIGCTSVLGIVFVVLKLIGQIDWSWWLVLMPFWLPSVVIGAMLAFVFVIAMACHHGGTK